VNVIDVNSDPPYPLLPPLSLVLQYKTNFNGIEGYDDLANLNTVYALTQFFL
jgi:hypothetical protein